MIGAAADGHPKYRPDVDGLRAVAVLAVVGFHAFPGSFKGGFVGVDVFFVISGYLISTIIMGQLAKGTFSFAVFYSRRVKRIFPALSLVLAACAIAGWFVLLPGEYAQLGKHMAGGAGFISNLVLLSEAGYFDTTAVTKPLLHLWSLGIEEQFYIVWPLLLFVARKRRIALLLVAILLGSFVLNLVLLPDHRVETFYNPVTRFWELLIGSSLAYVSLRQPVLLARLSERVRHPASMVGALLIAIAVLRFDAEQPFPGWRALLPTLGALLLIAAGPQAIVNRFALANRWMVGVGLISYPLYLWHWPLLTFARIVQAATPSPTVRLGAIILSFFLAWLTYRFVEKPIRLGAREKRFTVHVLMISIAALLVGGLGIASARGLPAARGPWNVANITQGYGEADQYTATCRDTEGHLFEPKFDRTLDFCHGTMPAPSTLDVVVVGDSHAGRIYSGLRAATTLTMLDLGRGSCLPFIGYDATNPGSDNLFHCSPTMDRLLDRTLELSPRVVVLSGFYVRAYDGRVTPRGRPLKTLMRETLERLSPRISKIVIVLDVPELPFDPSYCVDRPFNRAQGRGRCAFGKTEHEKRLALYEGDLRLAAKDLTNVSFFDPATVLCDADHCYGVESENLLYDDRHHLSRYGASLVGRALESSLR